MISIAKRVSQLPPLYYSVLNEARERARQKFGTNYIRLTIGSPDRPAPDKVMQALSKAATDYSNYRYAVPSYGNDNLLKSIARYLRRTDDVHMRYQEKIVVLNDGSRYALVVLLLSLVDPDDSVLAPGMAYPVYRNGIALASGRVVYYSVAPDDRGRLIDQFESLTRADLNDGKRAKVFIVCSPGNPTGDINDASFFKRLIHYVRQERQHGRQLSVISDEAYRRTTFDGVEAPSLMQFEGGEEVGVSVWTFSKTIHIAGSRIGVVHGNRQICEALKVVHTAASYGPFLPIQEAVIVGMGEEFDSYPSETAAMYQERRNGICDVFDKYGLRYIRPQGGMFVPLYKKKHFPEVTTLDLTANMLVETGVEVTPGQFFGPDGEDYLRIALVQPGEILQEGAELIGKYFAKAKK